MTTNDTSAPAIEHRIGSSGRLAVKLADWDLDVTGVDGETATVRSADGGSLPDGIEIERHGGGLTIHQPNRIFGLGGRSNVRLAITVPIETAATIQTASGDVRVARLRGRQEVRTASGDVVLDGIAEETSAETVSGDIAIRVDGTVALTVKTVSGDVMIDGGWVERISLQTTSGDIRLTSPLGAGPHTIVTVSGDAIVASNSGIRVTAQTVAGDLRTSLPHTSDGRAGRRALVVGDGSTEVAFRSVSGDLRVVDATTGGLSLPTPPTPPTPPTAPTPPEPATGPAAPSDDARLDILRAVERGEIDIVEASERLARLDGSTDD